MRNTLNRLHVYFLNHRFKLGNGRKPWYRIKLRVLLVTSECPEGRRLMLILASQEVLHTFQSSSRIKAICKPFILTSDSLSIIALEMNIYFECQASLRVAAFVLHLPRMLFLNVCRGGAVAMRWRTADVSLNAEMCPLHDQNPPLLSSVMV